MHFHILTRSGGEVRWAGIPDNGPVYYGGPPPESGSWKLAMHRLESYIATQLAGMSFGESVDTFELGFDLAELQGWGGYFTSTSRYITYRPGKKLLLSVGQLNWPDVKDLEAHAQFVLFSNTLLQAVAHISDMKRKPRDFNVSGFLDRLQRVLADCPIADVTASVGTREI